VREIETTFIELTSEEERIYRLGKSRNLREVSWASDWKELKRERKRIERIAIDGGESEKEGIGRT